jgi:hypothetical protein
MISTSLTGSMLRAAERTAWQLFGRKRQPRFWRWLSGKVPRLPRIHRDFG